MTSPPSHFIILLLINKRLNETFPGNGIFSIDMRAFTCVSIPGPRRRALAKHFDFCQVRCCFGEEAENGSLRSENIP